MPEDVPVRTCINVMVGITRSKVIWSKMVPRTIPNWRQRRCETLLLGLYAGLMCVYIYIYIVYIYIYTYYIYIYYIYIYDIKISLYHAIYIYIGNIYIYIYNNLCLKRLHGYA